MAAPVSRVMSLPRALPLRPAALAARLTGICTAPRSLFSNKAPTSRVLARVAERVELRASCLSASSSPSFLSCSSSSSSSSLSTTASALPIRIWTFDEVKQQVEALGSSNASNLGTVVLVELYVGGKIPGAVNVPWETSPRSFDISEDEFVHLHGFVRPPQDATLVFYCMAGIRARLAAQAAHRAGWNSVGVYRGSWLDWDAQQGPVELVPKRSRQ